jgi:LPS-assembly lipoprotein
MIPKKITLIAAFTLMAILSGCGFHLRGVVKLSAALHQLYIASDNPYGPITLQLKQILAHSGVILEDKPGPGIITLDIKNERYNTSTFSESASSKTKQYTLFLNLDYDLKNSGGGTLYGPKTITTQENYTVNESTVLTTTTQEDNVRASLQKQTVYLLLDQLNSKSVNTALQPSANNSNEN